MKNIVKYFMKINLLKSLLVDISQTSSIPNAKKIAQTIVEDSSLTDILKNKDIQQILKELLSNLSSKTKTSKAVLEMLKNETLFKGFKSFSSEIKNLLKLLDTTNIKQEKLTTLQQITTDIKMVDDKILKNNLSKSGIFLESYLKTFTKSINNDNLKQTILDDTKTILLKLNEENPDNKELLKQSNKLLAQIDYYQLLSLANYSNHTYLPFAWDGLENGDIEFKQSNNEQFVCHISLELKYYGAVKINMIFDKPNKLSMSFFVEQMSLKNKIQENLQKLRQAIKSVDIDLSLLSVWDMNQLKPNKQFEAYNSYQNNFGVDITV